MSECVISFNDVRYSYDGEKNALRGVSLTIEDGSYVAILGSNGSGKTTLAKHINALFAPDAGTVLVAGLDTSDPNNVFLVREQAGMVFQNPDNQLVTCIVEDDVAFGPENLGLDSNEIRMRVDAALDAVAMSSYAKSDPQHLSGGQKQRIAIAGVLAMRPRIVVLDEPGAMLDPRGRRGVRRVSHELNAAGITVVLITHFMEEALDASHVVVMHEGRIARVGTPQEVFTDEELLRTCGLEMPFAVRLARQLRERGIEVAPTISVDELVTQLADKRTAAAGVVNRIEPEVAPCH